MISFHLLWPVYKVPLPQTAMPCLVLSEGSKITSIDHLHVHGIPARSLVSPCLEYCCALTKLQLAQNSTPTTPLSFYNWLPVKFTILLLTFLATSKRTLHICVASGPDISDAQMPSLIIICSLAGTTISAQNARCCSNSFHRAAPCQHPPFIKLYWKRQIHWKPGIQFCINHPERWRLIY